LSKFCGDCRFYLKRGVCPLCEYKDHALNVAACPPTNTACPLFQPKNSKKTNSEQPDMGEALKLLNKYRYICPTDTKKVLVYNDGIYENAEPLIHKLLEEKYGEDLKKHFVEEAYAHIQRANYVEREQINKFTNKIPLQNGLFNLQTRELEPFSPDEIFTYKLNVKYNPEAKCPKWLQFVKEVVSEDDAPLLQEIMGYCLLPDMPFHKMFWFYGTGRNGKGVVTRTLEYILGKRNCANLNLSEFHESRRFSLCQLYGKLLNVSSEPPLSKRGLQTTVLKMATGQDTIRAELKGKNERLIFTNFAKIIVLGNRFPKVSDNSLGWWDRVVVLNFPNSFNGDKAIPNIEMQWLDDPEEVSGIFNWMLEGLYRLKMQNGFSSSRTTEETKAEFMKVSDPFNAWIIERCEKISHAYLTREEALEDYYNYCDEIGADRDPKKVFYEKMRQEPQVKDRKKRVAGKTVRVFQGITLKTEEVEEQIHIDDVKSEADEADEAGTIIRQSFRNNNTIKRRDNTRASSAPSASLNNDDIDKYFPKGQFPICFVCGKAVHSLSELTNVDGKPCHAECKKKLEIGRKSEGGDEK